MSAHSQNVAAKSEISLIVNGRLVTVGVHPMERLLDVLRGQLNLTGVKEGCGEGECGSCSVLMNGHLVNSCLVPVIQARDAGIVTIEGLAANDQLHVLQQAFLDCGGAQCGICTPGMIMAASHLLIEECRAEHGRYPRRAFRQPLPLYRLYADFRSRGRGRSQERRDVRSRSRRV